MDRVEEEGGEDKIAGVKKREKVEGVNVLRETVIVSIHHYCGPHVFSKPLLRLHAPITFLRPASTAHSCARAHTPDRTHTFFLLAIHQQLKQRINSIIHHTSP